MNGKRSAAVRRQEGAAACDASAGTGRRRGRRCDGQPQPRIWLMPFLLLALEQWQSYGYDLIQRMSAFGFGVVDSGRVYRILRRLEEDGLVVSGWDTSNDGPARRLYSLTDAGHEYLDTWADSIREYRSMLDRFLSLHAPVGTPPPEG
ncbi:MAG: helix-turn-helix transcriptional regulator [Thermoleophilia bacterium]